MNIDAVIVTYNRLEKLKKALSSLLSQTVPFRNIIIINNNSTDGTAEFLDVIHKSMDRIHVIHSKENVGGSGGFYIGQEYAMKLNPDWIYLQDDDAYPEKNANNEFISFINSNKHEISAVCGAVYKMDGNIDNTHRSNLSFKYGFIPELKHVDSNDYKRDFIINTLSYVGAYIKYDAMLSNGLVNKDFFIYSDDVEHGLRLSNSGCIYCVPKIKVCHEGGQLNQKSNLITWREYYYYRNWFYTLLINNKKAAIYFFIKTYLSRYLHYGRKGRRLVLDALLDAYSRRLGIHKKYNVSFKLDKSE